MAGASNQTILITGGTGGIGREMALDLAGQGANVVIVGRSQDKAQAIIKEAQARKSGTVEFIPADLSKMQQVREVAQTFKANHNRLDVLVHSAGIHWLKSELTEDGIEYNFAANYLARFLLTNLLIDMLTVSAPARIVIIGSPYKFDPKRFLNFKGVQEPPRFPIWALLKSGLAVGVWTAELARRLKNSGITVNNVNPGLVKTDILRNDPWVMRILDQRIIQPIWGMSPREGAKTPLWVATSTKFENTTGQFFRVMKPYKVPRGTYDPELAERLWNFSQKLTEQVSTKVTSH